MSCMFEFLTDQYTMAALELKDLPIDVIQITNSVLISNQWKGIFYHPQIDPLEDHSMKESFGSCPLQSGPAIWIVRIDFHECTC